MTLHQDISTAQIAAWEQSSELLDVLRDDPTDIIAFIAHCSADDLHQFDCVHGIAAEVEIFEAILHHPKCDRATALQIFEACNPQYYEKELANGRALDSYDEEQDQVFIAILDIAHAMLCNRPDWQGRFGSVALRDWETYPHTSPSTFNHWTLPAAVMIRTQDQRTHPSITYQYSSIRLTYHAWAQRQ